MRSVTAILSFLVLFTAGQSTAEDNAISMKPGLYVVVDELESSRLFYQRLFGIDPYIDTGDFIGFRLGESLFALFSKQAVTHELSRGNAVVPYIQVDDIDAAFNRAKSISPKMIHDHVLTEGPIKLFMFTDPSGNAIEFFSVNSDN